MRYLYGNLWEKYPIEVGKIWREISTDSFICICDIMKNFPRYMYDADFVYCDPPWNLGNANLFNAKAGVKYRHKSFDDFYEKLFWHISIISPIICYIEIGRQNKQIFEFELRKLFPVVQKWEIKYYKKNDCILLRGGYNEQNFDFTGYDDEETPLLAIKHENNINVIADLCTGRGITFLASFKLGKKFVGTEFNKYRLAVAIDRIVKLGGKFESTIS